MLMLRHHTRQTKTEHFKAEAGGKVLVAADWFMGWVICSCPAVLAPTPTHEGSESAECWRMHIYMTILLSWYSPQAFRVAASPKTLVVSLFIWCSLCSLCWGVNMLVNLRLPPASRITSLKTNVPWLILQFINTVTRQNFDAGPKHFCSIWPFQPLLTFFLSCLVVSDWWVWVLNRVTWQNVDACTGTILSDLTQAVTQEQDAGLFPPELIDNWRKQILYDAINLGRGKGSAIC